MRRDAWCCSSVSGRPYMTARGFRWALAYEATATAPNCALVVPNSCMWRRASSAYIWAGDNRPKGAMNACGPPMDAPIGCADDP